MYYVNCEKNTIIISTKRDDTKIQLGAFIHLDTARTYAHSMRRANDTVVERLEGEV